MKTGTPLECYISREGETEEWYFTWLQTQINNSPKATRKVKFHFIKSMPSSFAKSNADTYTKERLSNKYFCRIQDVEDYSPYQINKFNSMLKSNKDAASILPFFPKWFFM